MKIEITTQQAHRQGVLAGRAAWRPSRPHAIPQSHPPGFTPEGREWFLGLAEGLEAAQREHQHHPETFDDQAYLNSLPFRSNPATR